MLLSGAQSEHLWRRDRRRRGDGAVRYAWCRDPRNAGMDADARVGRGGGESWRAWTRDGDGDDPSMFAAWAQTYARSMTRHRRIDAAQLGDALAVELADDIARGVHALFVGFMQLTVQQQRLIDALTRRGASIDRISAPQPRSTPGRVLASTARDELRAALTWARERAIARPDAAIGIVVEDLARRRDQVIALADEILSPALCLPAGLGVQRPYEISLGVSLAEVPLVASALRPYRARRGFASGGRGRRAAALPLLAGRRNRGAGARADRTGLARCRALTRRLRRRCGGARQRLGRTGTALARRAGANPASRAGVAARMGRRMARPS